MRHLVPAVLAASFLSSPGLAQEARPEAFQIGLGLQQRGLHEEAARYFERFLQAEPRHTLAPEAWYRLGTSRAERGLRAPAVQALEEALQCGGASFALRAECRYRLGNLFEAAGEHRRACEQFAALAAEVPADHYLLAAARYAEGEAAREQGDDARAEVAFKAAVAAATGDRQSFRFPALYQLGFAQLRQERLADAAATFAAAADAAPDDAGRGECHYLRGDLLLRGGETAGARSAFTTARRLASEFADDAQLGLGFAALQAGEAEAARREFARVVEEFAASPLGATARLEIARSLYTEGRHDEAAQRLAALLDASAAVADDVRQQARELNGLCALASGRGEAALAQLQQALTAAPAADRPRLSFALGEAHADLGQWEAALAAYDAVPADAPASLRGEALYGACFALHQLGRPAESSAGAAALRALEPPHRLRPQATFAIAENAFATGDYAAAEREYAALADDAAHRDRAAWKRAWCRYLEGAHEDAAERFGAIAAAATSFAEEALSMQALASCEAGRGEAALALADRYRVRFPTGEFLDRTERTAARVLRQRGDLAAARQRLARAAAAAAGAQALADRAEQAELAYLQGDFAAADALFAELAAADGAAGARAAAGRAWCAFELGDDAACAERLEAAFAHAAADGERAGLLELRSALAHRRADWPAAIAAAREFLQRFPRHDKAPAMRYALGVAEARSGDSATARRTLAGLARDGGYERSDRVHYELAWACRRDGDEAAALAAFAVVAEGDDAELVGEARLHLGTAALAAGDFVAARAHLGGVTGSHRGKALYRLGFAELDAADGDVERLAAARDHFAAITALPDEPLRGEALFLGAECCHRLQDLRGASERLQRLLADEPGHERADRARLLLGECAVGLDDPATAIAALEPYVRAAQVANDGEPGDAARADLARAHLWLGRARLQRGEHEAAEANFLRVTGLSESALAAEAQFRIGESRLARDDLAGAADAFVKLPILYGHAEWVRRGLLQAGRVYRRLQQPEKAERFFRELLQQHADSEEARAAGELLRER